MSLPFCQGVPLATHFDPWCGPLLWPGCAWPDELVQDFHCRVAWLQTDCRSGYPPLVLTGFSVREELQGIIWTVSLRNSTTADAVHPRSGKFLTNLATVQEYMAHMRKLPPGGGRYLVRSQFPPPFSDECSGNYGRQQGSRSCVTH